MLEIIAEGKTVDITDEPNYVKLKEETSCWVKTDKENAQAIAAYGVLYNILGREKTLEDRPEAYVREFDAGKFLLNQYNAVNDLKAKIEQLTADIDYLSTMTGNQEAMKKDNGDSYEK